MIAEYKRDMNHTYLILKEEGRIDTAAYPVRMLLANTVPHLLKCKIQGLDGQTLFCYEMTSRQPMTSFYEKKLFQKEDLETIFGNYLQIMEKLEEYLLNPGQLLLNPDYIFLEPGQKELFFCYLPGFQGDAREQFRTLVEYLLPKLDHGDEAAVELGYCIYRKALEDDFQAEMIRGELYRIREAGRTTPVMAETKFTEEKIETTDKEDIQIPEIPETDLFVRTSEPVSQKGQGKVLQGKRYLRMIIGCLSGAGIMALVVIASHFGYLPQLGIHIILGGAVAGAGAALLIFLFMSFIDKRRRPEKEKEQKQSDAMDPLSGYERKDLQKTSETEPETCRETVVLSMGKTDGPASLVSREPGEFATIYLKEELTIIGKMKTAADAVIPLPTVSRLHAKVRKKEDGYYLSDLNSRNGTSVNGVMLKGEEEYLLQDEDEVDFAQARFVFLK